MNLIHAKLATISSQIQSIPKNSTNKDEQWKFRSIYDIYNHLQPIFRREGVFLLPKILDSSESIVNTQKGRAFRVKIKVEWIFSCSDGSSISSVMLGEGIDSSDKASNKALTASLKYLLIYMNLIPTVPFEIDSDFSSPTIAPFEDKNEPRHKTLLGLAESKGLTQDDLKVIGIKLGFLDGEELKYEDKKKMFDHILNKTKDELIK